MNLPGEYLEEARIAVQRARNNEEAGLARRALVEAQMLEALFQFPSIRGVLGSS
jgi:hypothetical protein